MIGVESINKFGLYLLDFLILKKIGEFRKGLQKENRETNTRSQPSSPFILLLRSLHIHELKFSCELVYYLTTRQYKEPIGNFALLNILLYSTSYSSFK